MQPLTLLVKGYSLNAWVQSLVNLPFYGLWCLFPSWDLFPSYSLPTSNRMKIKGFSDLTLWIGFAFVKGFLLGFLDLLWIVYRFLGFLRFFTTTKTSCWYDFWRSLFGNCTTGKFSFPLRIYLFIGITLSDYKIAQGEGFCNRECCINLTIPPCIKGRIYIIWIISPCIFGISMIW